MRVQILPRPFLKSISKAHVAQQQRRWSQKPEVAGANPAMGTNLQGISTGQACRGRLLNVRICGSRLGCKSSGFRHFQNARVAQLAEAPVLETGGWGCKSLHEYHFQNPLWQSQQCTPLVKEIMSVRLRPEESFQCPCSVVAEHNRLSPG